MTTIRQADSNDVEFILDHEGCPLNAYPDAGGVITIGPGFTMRSRVFAAYWMSSRGHALRMGDTISKLECLTLLKAMVNEEYGAAVASSIVTEEQHVFGGSTSVVYNCGAGALAWKWAGALRAKMVDQACTLLLTTAITVNGRVLDGLKHRRADEARLIRTGDYGFVTVTEDGKKASPSAVSTSPAAVREYQGWLKTLGLYSGAVDGLPSVLTTGAVKNFQRANRLKVDGVVGPATRSAMLRALAAAQQRTHATAGGLGTGALAGFTGSPTAMIITAVAVLAVVFIGYELWSHRGKLTGQRTPA